MRKLCANIKDDTINTDFTETIIESDLDFINLALTYGNSVKSRKDSEIIDILIALTSDQVEKDSLTKRYGLNQFPKDSFVVYQTLIFLI